MYYFDIGLIFKISPPGSIFIKPILNVKGPPPNDLHCDLSGFEDDTGKPENNFYCVDGFVSLSLIFLWSR